MDFQEIFEAELKLIEGKALEKQTPFIAKLLFPWNKADKENNNHRTYSEKVLAPAVTELNTRIEASGVPGQSDHPDAGSGGITKLRDVSHVLTKVWMKDKTAWAEAGILDTTKGRDALTVIKSGVPIGASLRGFGQLDSKGHVKPGLKIKTIDLVVDPSFGENARVDQSSIIESYVPEEEQTVDSVIENSLQEEFYYLLKKQGLPGIGTLQQFKESGMLERLTAKTQLKEKYDEIVKSGHRLPRFEAWLKTFPADKNVAEEKTINTKVRVDLFREAKQAGFKGTVEELMQNQLKETISEGNLRAESRDIKAKRPLTILFQEAKQSGFPGTLEDYRKFLLNGSKK